MTSVELLVAFAETLDPHLGKHMRAVAPLANRVARQLGLDNDQVARIETAARIHDIGLLGLPKDLQTRDESLLSEEQYRQYCEHPVLASIALERDDRLNAVGEIVLYHHEYMNGTGFPAGLGADQIPIGSRIVLAVSDYCRIIGTWPREVRKLISHARRHLDAQDFKSFAYSDDPEEIVHGSAVKILLKNADGKYDARVVQALIRVIHEAKNMDPPAVLDVEQLKTGMTLMEDLRLKGGRLLLSKGARLDAKSINAIRSMTERGMIPHKIYVSVPRAVS